MCREVTSSALIGAEIVSLKIVSDGVFNRDGMLEELVEKPAKYEGCSGCRNIRDVESDLKAVSLHHLSHQAPTHPNDMTANRGKSQRDWSPAYM